MHPWKLVPLRSCQRRKAAELTSTGIPGESRTISAPGCPPCPPSPGPCPTSYVEGSLTVQCVVLARVVHGHGAATVNGQVHHLVKGHQLHGVELPVVDGLSTGRDGWVTEDAPRPKQWGWMSPVSGEGVPGTCRWPSWGGCQDHS